MVKEYKSALGKVYLTIETDTENRWIFTDWQGYLTAENIKVGAKAYVDALAKAGFSCVLNDTRSVRGPWDHSMEWVLNEWAPSAARAGLRHFAMITTPETLADSSNATFYAQLTAFEAQLFDNMADARDWLRQQCS
ncbi:MULTISPECIES: STAS/SEC14 domain-containing protein [Hymenobacter]|uniref:STAS/SEC14 domain-containing protein n=1 Tax=Hymenobacter wooponensis TaxID=1525360 RepID=A0A4Z0MA81_9BACT|nr:MULTISPECIES: STAS/SEC14 domain-containing protein [Hymenobacter]RPD43579.1 STAS/SEC14 domain-containing protein [Hymenobacter sediminis]TGD76603.1 STAS/SEC14 domain-containing protein [Hymenobacter wooponensis]